jgi:hypothetical protein
MNTVNLPGFTAESSVYSPDGQFRTVFSETSYASGGEVTPQTVVCRRNQNGEMICVDPLCRFRCRFKKGAALQDCLSNCD